MKRRCGGFLKKAPAPQKLWMAETEGFGGGKGCPLPHNPKFASRSVAGLLGTALARPRNFTQDFSGSKENFLKKVFLDLSKTLNSPKLRFGQRKGEETPPFSQFPKATSCFVLDLFGPASFGPKRCAGLSLRKKNLPFFRYRRNKRCYSDTIHLRGCTDGYAPSSDSEETNDVIRLFGYHPSSVGVPTDKSCSKYRRKGVVTLPLFTKRTVPPMGCWGILKGEGACSNRKLVFRLRFSP